MLNVRHERHNLGSSSGQLFRAMMAAMDGHTSYVSYTFHIIPPFAVCGYECLCLCVAHASTYGRLCVRVFAPPEQMQWNLIEMQITKSFIKLWKLFWYEWRRLAAQSLWLWVVCLLLRRRHRTNEQCALARKQHCPVAVLQPLLLCECHCHHSTLCVTHINTVCCDVAHTQRQPNANTQHTPADVHGHQRSTMVVVCCCCC